MADIPQIRVISAAEVLQPSSRFPVSLQDESMPILDGIFFSNDEDAVRFKASERPDMQGKIEIPLELSMEAAFRPEDPDSSNRLGKDFRIVLDDREVAPAQDDACTVMPYVLFNGITSLALRVVKTEDEVCFRHDSFWLNVLEPGASQPFSGVSDAILQVILNPSEKPVDEVIDRYLALRERAGMVLQRIINAPVDMTKLSQP